MNSAQPAGGHDRLDIGEALRQSEERFRLLVESVQDYAIFMLDPRGHVISWNLGAERLKGYREEEILGQHFSAFYTPEDVTAGRPERLLNQALDEGTARDEGWRVRQDGSLFRASVVITALRDAADRHVGFAKVTRDVTEQHRQDESARALARAELMASEERFASLAQHLPGLAWIKDTDGRYTYINDATEGAFGAPRDGIIGHTDAELFPADTAEEFRANDQKALESWTGIQVIERLTDATGMVRHSIVSKFPIADADGSFHLIGGVAIDITDRVTAEQALHEADRRKTEFLSTLSHELRNPLAPIRNSVHLLQMDSSDIPRDRVYRILDQQLDHLVRLVDDLLELSRISSGKVILQLESTDLNTLVQGAAEACAHAIAAKNHHFHVQLAEGPATVHGDAVRLAQVVVNLLNNAAKYTPDGGEIWLGVRSDGADWLISVRDTGVGIPNNMLPRVFDMFAQVDQTLHRSQGGLGIGLALARSLVELHGGRIDAYSAGLGLGSEFVVRVHRAGAITAGEKPAGPPARARTRLRIVLVDDNRDAADSLGMILSGLGAEVRCAYDGPSALELIRSWKPATALLDLGMPGMDGYEIAARIRRDPSIRDIRLVALTGWGSAADRRRTTAAGFDEHWVKPVDPSRLSRLLAETRTTSSD